MSEVKFQTKMDNKNVEVLAGWDPVLHRYFLVITDLDFDYENNSDDEDEQTDLIWSNLDHPENTYNMDNYMSALSNYKITPPPNFRKLCETKTHYYEYIDGSWKKPE